MTERWTSTILYLLGVWNIFAGASALADPTQHLTQFYAGGLNMADPVQAFFFRATWINASAWGLSYLLAARRPAARVPVLAAGAAGKTAYALAVLGLFLDGDGSTALLAFGVLDLVFAATFAAILWTQRSRLAVQS
ncbi:MAG: hypothetical protein EXR52_04445 [Dehalococcoidia bacterium]|nr:hypothetical protein [Dehalococcoidia bacterium]